MPIIATVEDSGLDKYLEAMAPAIAVLTSVKYPLSNKTDFITPVCESKRIIKPLLEGSPNFGLLKKPEATFTAKLSKPSMYAAFTSDSP